jgi:hypothetical protein
MTALAKNSNRPSKGMPKMLTFPVAASTTIYQGGLVIINSSGYAIPAAASAGNKGCAGVAMQKADNASGSAGAISVTVAFDAVFLFAGTTLAQASIGSACYAEDDNTIDDASGTNEAICGVLVEYVSSSSGWVHVGGLLENVALAS